MTKCVTAYPDSGPNNIFVDGRLIKEGIGKKRRLSIWYYLDMLEVCWSFGRAGFYPYSHSLQKKRMSKFCLILFLIENILCG